MSKEKKDNGSQTSVHSESQFGPNIENLLKKLQNGTNEKRHKDDDNNSSDGEQPKK